MKSVSNIPLYTHSYLVATPHGYTKHYYAGNFRGFEGSEETDIYYCHSDHLGSASWITDESGSPIQHLQYLPFGEPFVDQRMTNYSERFTFTGKERDEETGYYYFDARYLWSTIGFLSVDPLSDKYPSTSAYMYCLGNPVRLVDPNGMDVWEVDSKGYVKATDDKTGGTKVQTVKYGNGKTKTFEGGSYHSMLNDLSGTDNVSYTKGGKGSLDAMADMFMSMSDNTNVEWRMEQYSENGNTEYSLGTKHSKDVSPGSEAMGHSPSSVTALIHSHPGAQANQKSELESMGYEYNGKSLHGGDISTQARSFYKANFYIYMKNSSTIWKTKTVQKGESNETTFTRTRNVTNPSLLIKTCFKK